MLTRLANQDEYAEYRKNTSILIPMIGYRHVPLGLKRTVPPPESGSAMLTVYYMAIV